MKEGEFQFHFENIYLPRRALSARLVLKKKISQSLCLLPNHRNGYLYHLDTVVLLDYQWIRVPKPTVLFFLIAISSINTLRAIQYFLLTFLHLDFRQNSVYRVC